MKNMMTYKVAGRFFRLVVPEGFPLDGRIDNYAPFGIEDDSSCKLAFEAELVKPFEAERGECIYCDRTQPDMPRIEIYRSATEWLVEVAPLADAEIVGRFVASLDFSKIRFCVLDEREFDFVLNDVMMLAFAFTTVGDGVLEMHASVVAHADKGFLFLGTSGTGKSTHSRLWLEHVEGCSLLNDDNPIVAIGDDGEVRVYGSPWSGKTPCYKNESYPVGAFVSLSQSKENKISQQSLLEAYASLFSSTSCLKSDSDFVDALHDTIGIVVTQVPCYQLDCLPDRDAALLCAETVSIVNG